MYVFVFLFTTANELHISPRCMPFSGYGTVWRLLRQLWRTALCSNRLHDVHLCPRNDPDGFLKTRLMRLAAVWFTGLFTPDGGTDFDHKKHVVFRWQQDVF